MIATMTIKQRHQQDNRFTLKIDFQACKIEYEKTIEKLERDIKAKAISYNNQRRKYRQQMTTNINVERN